MVGLVKLKLKRNQKRRLFHGPRWRLVPRGDFLFCVGCLSYSVPVGGVTSRSLVWEKVERWYKLQTGKVVFGIKGATLHHVCQNHGENQKAKPETLHCRVFSYCSWMLLVFIYLEIRRCHSCSCFTWGLQDSIGACSSRWSFFWIFASSDKPIPLA